MSGCKVPANIRIRVLEVKLIFLVQEFACIRLNAALVVVEGNLDIGILSIIPSDRHRCYNVHTLRIGVEGVGEVEHPTDGLGTRYTRSDERLVVGVISTRRWIGGNSPRRDRIESIVDIDAVKVDRYRQP